MAALSGVLISGGTQPLGILLARRLVDQGKGPVLIVGTEEKGSVDLPPEVAYLRIDLTNDLDVRGLLSGPCRELGVTAIVNLAFHRDPGLGAAGHRLNVQATRRLLELAEGRSELTHFVHRSTSDVYVRRSKEPDIVREDRPLNLVAHGSSWIRDRVEIDALVCTRMGLADHLTITVLRCAEILAPNVGSQLHDYLSSRVCLRRMGFDPMLNLLSLPDATMALELALEARASGTFNIPGADTLPLSRAIRLWGRNGIPVPSPLLGPLYALRRGARGTRFRYRANRWRLHYNSILDGTRAAEVLGYRPQFPIHWPTRARTDLDSN